MVSTYQHRHKASRGTLNDQMKTSIQQIFSHPIFLLWRFFENTTTITAFSLYLPIFQVSLSLDVMQERDNRRPGLCPAHREKTKSILSAPS